MAELKFGGIKLGGRFENHSSLLYEFTPQQLAAIVEEYLTKELRINEFYEMCSHLAPIPIANGSEPVVKPAIKSLRAGCLDALNKCRPSGDWRIDSHSATAIYKPEPPDHRDITKLVFRSADGKYWRYWDTRLGVGNSEVSFTVELIVTGCEV